MGVCFQRLVGLCLWNVFVKWIPDCIWSYCSWRSEVLGFESLQTSAWEVPCLFTPYQIILRICEEINSVCLAHIFIRCLGRSWRFLAIMLEVVRSVRWDNSTLLPLPSYHEPPIAIPTESLNLKVIIWATNHVYSFRTFSLPPNFCLFSTRLSRTKVLGGAGECGYLHGFLI